LNFTKIKLSKIVKAKKILIIAFGKSRKIAPIINNIPINSMRLTCALKKGIKIRVVSSGAKALASMF
tara:strand:+ start:219 stop:419 length:201 start_codon:yes stop_codon:yes gene_type:complete